MTDKPTKDRGVSRRGFMRLLGVGAGASSAALSATASQAASPAEVGRADDSSAGYRESEHVRTYYSHARI